MLRLPFPAVTVYFGADLAFDPAFLRWSEGLDEPARQFPAQVAQAAYGGEAPSVAMADLTNGIRTLGGYLTGITMFANAQGRLTDEALFVVATNPDPTFTDARAKDRARGAIHGRLSRSTLAPLVTHLALAVQWGSWQQRPGSWSCHPILARARGARPPTPAASDERNAAVPWSGSGSWTPNGPAAPEGPPRPRPAVPALRRTCGEATGGGCGSAHGLTGIMRAAGSLQLSSTLVAHRCPGCPSIACRFQRPRVPCSGSPTTPDWHSRAATDPSPGPIPQNA